MKVELIKFGTLEAALAFKNRLELELNKRKFTMYNGFNFENSFLNIKPLESDIEYLNKLIKVLKNENKQ